MKKREILQVAMGLYHPFFSSSCGSNNDQVGENLGGRFNEKHETALLICFLKLLYADTHMLQRPHATEGLCESSQPMRRMHREASFQLIKNK